MNIRTSLLFAVTMLAAAGCGSTPTSPSTSGTSTSQFFVTTLAPNGTGVYTFAVSAQSYIAITLASVTSAATGEPLGTDLSLVLGTPSGASCSATTTVTAIAQLSAQITQRLGQGTYCINVKDNGGLPETATIAARMTATSNEPAASTNNQSETFTSQLAANGTAERTFTTTFGGTSQLTLATAASDKTFRLSVGLWDGSVCRLTVSTDTLAGGDPQITEGIDRGQYCVRVRDASSSGRTNFAVIVAHP